MLRTEILYVMREPGGENPPPEFAGTPGLRRQRRLTRFSLATPSGFSLGLMISPASASRCLAEGQAKCPLLKSTMARWGLASRTLDPGIVAACPFGSDALHKLQRAHAPTQTVDGPSTRRDLLLLSSLPCSLFPDEPGRGLKPRRRQCDRTIHCRRARGLH